MTILLNHSGKSDLILHENSYVSPTMLGWRLPRKVAYIHRHPLLNDHCLYFWDQQEQSPVATQSQGLVFLLEDIYHDKRGEFQADKLILDVDLGLDGRLRLITGFTTACATTLMGSFAALSPRLLAGPMSMRLRPGTSHGVVLPTLYVEGDWVDGRPMSRDDCGKPIPAIDMLTEVQTLLKHALSVQLLPHEARRESKKAA